MINTAMVRNGNHAFPKAHIFDGHKSVTNAMQEAGMMYTVHRVPLIARLHGKEVVSPNKYSLVREETRWDNNNIRILRTVSGRYHPLQNKTLADVLDPLGWGVESTGVAKNGQVVFVQLGSDSHFRVNGLADEEHTQTLLVVNDHTKNSLYYGLVTVRLFCENQFQTLIGGMMAIPHSQNTILELEFQRDLQQQVIRAQQQQQKDLDRLFHRKLQTGELNKFAEQVFPDPPKKRAMKAIEGVPFGIKETGAITSMKDLAERETAIWEAEKRKSEERRHTLAEEFFVFNEQHPYAADTAFAAFNAATSMTSRGISFTGSVDKRQESLLLGGVLKDVNTRAWEAALALV